MAPVSGDFEKSPVALHPKRPARGLARRVARKISLMGNRIEEKHPDSLNTLTSTVKSSSGLKPILKQSHEEPKLNQTEMICEVDIHLSINVTSVTPQRKLSRELKRFYSNSGSIEIQTSTEA